MHGKRFAAAVVPAIALLARADFPVQAQISPEPAARLATRAGVVREQTGAAQPATRAGVVRDQKIDGLWSTIDDKTHQPRGVVRIYQENGQYFGQIVAAFDPKDALERCTPCSGALHNKPVIGLVILRDMREHGDEFSGGTIVDPDTGQIYRCKMTLEDNGRKLLVRGYIGVALFGRTQVWTRYTPPPSLRKTGGL